MSAQMSNSTTELAKTRNRAAAERTTLAWIRTALALISFGFGLDIIIGAILLLEVDINGIIAGVWLAVDTLVSLWLWSRRKEETQQVQFKKIQLENLRF